MTVYLEVVIINNLLLDALLIYIVLLVRRRRVRRLRLLLAALIGCITAVFYAIASDAWRIAIRFLLAPIMCLVFDKYDAKGAKRKLKDYLANLAGLCIATFVLGGFIYGANYLLGVDVKRYALLGIIALSAIVLLAVCKYAVITHSKRKREFCGVKLEIGGHHIEVQGFCDSGNTLTDGVSGCPVIILSQETEKRIATELYMRQADTGDSESGFAGKCPVEGFVNIKTVNGESLVPIVKFDNVEVGQNRFQAYGALSRRSFDGFDVILQNSMF